MNEFEVAGVRALQQAFERFQALGPQGTEVVQKNQFGDTVLRLDLEAEEAVLEALTESRLPIRIRSEEHGTVDVGEEEPLYLGVLDGLDGSAAYKKDPLHGRAGTMLALFDSLDPTYDSYLFNGIMETTGRLFFACRGAGAYVRKEGAMRQVRTSGRTALDRSAKIYADQYIGPVYGIHAVDEVLRKLKGYPLLPRADSSAVHFADLASGAADLVLECTRKGNLELGAAYGLVREAGGMMLAVDGRPLGPERYLAFGQESNIPIIAAATSRLAQAVLEKLR